MCARKSRICKKERNSSQFFFKLNKRHLFMVLSKLRLHLGFTNLFVRQQTSTVSNTHFFSSCVDTSARVYLLNLCLSFCNYNCRPLHGTWSSDNFFFFVQSSDSYFFFFFEVPLALTRATTSLKLLTSSFSSLLSFAFSSSAVTSHRGTAWSFADVPCCCCYICVTGSVTYTLHAFSLQGPNPTTNW